MNDCVEVCAAVVIRGGRVLLATRRKNAHLGGSWEFPGGKVESGETLSGCIRRELMEELGMEIREASFLFRRVYDYPGKQVALNFMLCTADPEASAVGREGQQVGWFLWSEAGQLALAPADRCFFDEIRRKAPLEP